MKVIICGDRYWTDYDAIEKYIRTLPPRSTIIHGDCKGADKIAAHLGEGYGHEVIPEPAKWDDYGNAAGPIRNKLMLDKYNPDLVVAFHRDISKSKGTKDMVNRAKKRGVEVIFPNECNPNR